MKRTTSLIVLISMILMTTLTVFGDDIFYDFDAIKYKESAVVMSSTGIMTGYPDGYFYPENHVTRAEMAKILCALMNGGEDIQYKYDSSYQFSDTEGHWADAYIKYCVKEGIVSGRTKDFFDPDTYVTGIEVAKMLLVALGYEPGIEGYTGNECFDNILKAADDNSFFTGIINFNPYEPVNREIVSQLILNGLKAETVEYDYQMIITTEEPAVTLNTTLEKTGVTLYDKFFQNTL